MFKTSDAVAYGLEILPYHAISSEPVLSHDPFGSLREALS